MATASKAPRKSARMGTTVGLPAATTTGSDLVAQCDQCVYFLFPRRSKFYCPAGLLSASWLCFSFFFYSFSGNRFVNFWVRGISFICYAEYIIWGSTLKREFEQVLNGNCSDNEYLFLVAGVFSLTSEENEDWE